MEILVLPLLSYIIIGKMYKKINKKQIPTLLMENKIQKYVKFMLNCPFSAKWEQTKNNSVSMSELLWPLDQMEL